MRKLIIIIGLAIATLAFGGCETSRTIDFTSPAPNRQAIDRVVEDDSGNVITFYTNPKKETR